MKGKRKILFFHFDMKGGGAENVLVNLVNNLNRDKYDITVQTIFGVGPYIDKLAPHIHYKYIFKKQFSGFTKLQKLISPKILHKLFIKEKYDLEIAYLETSPTRIVSGCPHSETKLMAWLHITINEFPWFRSKKELQQVYSKFDKVVSVSKDVQSKFIESSGINNLPFCIQRNVVDTNFIKSQAKKSIEIDIDKSKINLFYIGRFVPAKDPIRLLRALKNIKAHGHENWHLYFLGKGELENEIKSYVSENKLNEFVSLLGFQSNPYKFIEKMDLYICSSHAEGYSTAATESLILGIPVFTTNCGGMDEILENGKYGIIVPDDDSEFEKGLEDILINPSKMKHFKMMSIKRGPFFETKQIIAENENLIDYVLK